MIAFNDLGLMPEIKVTPVELAEGQVAEVRSYLPIAEKGAMLQYIAERAIDLGTGTFSPLRVEVYFALAICRWYGDIEFDEDIDVGEVYDIISTNHITEKIISAIDEDEWHYINGLVEETIQDMARYNSSAAGIIANMSQSAGTLEEQVNSIFDKIKNREGLELLGAIRDAEV